MRTVPMDTPGLPDRILYEDNHLIAVNKLPSEIVQGDKTGDTPLADKVREYIRQKHAKPGNVYLGVVHRIDRPVGGVVLFARTSKALVRLNAMVKDRRIVKTYLAVVRNRPPRDSEHLVHFLKKNEKQNKSYVVSETTPGARKGELVYALAARSDTHYLLRIDLMTGRHHQIRAQLAAVGCPVRGDVKYGFDRPNADGSIHLHAQSVELVHPVRQEKIRIEAPLPGGDRLWQHFRDRNPE